MHVEVDVSKTIADTMQRNGFQLCPDGSAMQIKVQNCPAIPRRKTTVVFVENPEDNINLNIYNNAVALLKRLSQCNILDVSEDGKLLKNEIVKLVGA